MKYHLLTGATGLLGRYLIRDLTIADVPLAVIARKSKNESASQRIETAMSYWEKELGRSLVRPVVLEGDITKPNLGLGSDDLQWVKEFCDTFIHSAASLTFYAEDNDPGAEPWLSNITGTRHVLALCRTAGIKKFHHVSTAYVCGTRRGVILETELDEGQVSSNDYETSKIQAEKEVRGAQYLDQTTVFRPSIIVGDSSTGYTTSYHGFYTPLRLVHAMATSIPWETILQGDFLGGLQINGEERKNLVPVQWVSAAMTEVISNPKHHGQTYHLTNPKCSTAADMLIAISSAISEIAESNQHKIANTVEVDEMVDNFRDQMQVYQSYWNDDPTFDSTHTEDVLPHLPCPEINQDVMNRLIAYAITKNFGWPREAPSIPDIRWEEQWKPWFAAAEQLPDANSSRQYLNFCISGAGGGQWHMIIEHGRLKGVRAGLHSNDKGTCYLNSNTSGLLANGRLSWENAVYSGRLMLSGIENYENQIPQLIHELFDNNYSISSK